MLLGLLWQVPPNTERCLITMLFEFISRDTSSFESMHVQNAWKREVKSGSTQSSPPKMNVGT